MKIVTRIVVIGVVGALSAGCSAGPSPESAESTGSASAARHIGGDAGCAGVGSVFCINGGHWDPQQCRCVPPDAGCVDNILCILGTHWDASLCKCVPDAKPAAACVSQEDGPCGGFIINPCTCAPGLTCVPNKIADLPGTCQPARCCPAGWDMYACREEDGTSGLNCHDPQLACASSLTCGAGCDFEVTGRCPVCDPIVCPAGETFDRVQCKCVPGCNTAADCTGPLPNVCEVCDAGSGCAHWTCVAHQCETAFCP
jgi:hypothetical protein